jgi:NDP-sugar pyrophosphorylase family protein
MIDRGAPSGSDQSARHLPRNALVLTAGLGTRLRPLTYVRAKAAVPVNGETLARRAIRWLVSHGIRDLVLNLHHKPETIAASVGDGADMSARVRYSWEYPVLGSAGGPRRALPLLVDGLRGGDASFLILNGDTLSNVDVADVVRAHESSGALVTMAAVPNREPDKYSALAVNGDGAVTGVVPRGGKDPSFHFYGVQVVEASVFAALPDNTAIGSVSDVYPSLWTSQPGSVRAFITDAEYMDIGTPAGYLATSLALAGRERSDLIGRRCRVAPGARLDRSVLWDDVAVGDGALLRECVVTDGVSVPADTSWHGVTLRVATGALAPGERRIDHLAIGSL